MLLPEFEELIRTFCVAVALIALPAAADARQRVRTPAISPECNVTMPCDGVGAPPAAARAFPLPAGAARVPPAIETRSTSYAAGIVAPLAAKLASIQAACPGTHAISGIRHTRVAGSRRMSLHAQGKAVDVRGPYGCIYAQLKDWKGGYSTDAGRAQHIHISYDEAGGREMGLRFAHGGGRRAAWRNAYARMR